MTFVAKQLITNAAKPYEWDLAREEILVAISAAELAGFMATKLALIDMLAAMDQSHTCQNERGRVAAA